jgi:hypothetical protein
MTSSDLALYPNQLPRVVSRGPVLVREDFLYTNSKGEEKDGHRKKAERALDNLQDTLTKVLEPQEAVFYIARAVSPLSFFERFTLGWQAYHMYGSVLVFTNRRLLRFGVKGKGWRNWTWRRTLHAARWGDIAEAKCKGFLTRILRLKYRSGRKETYLNLDRADAKKIKMLLGAFLPSAAAEAGPAQEMVSLCPECIAPLTPRVYRCPQCRLEFKTEKSLLWRTIIIPGGGYFYVGWRGFAFFFGLLELLIIYEIVFWLCVALGLVPAPAPGPGQTRLDATAAAFVLAYLLILFALETTIVYLHMRRFVREFTPVR